MEYSYYLQPGWVHNSFVGTTIYLTNGTLTENRGFLVYPQGLLVTVSDETWASLKDGTAKLEVQGKLTVAGFDDYHFGFDNPPLGTAK